MNHYTRSPSGRGTVTPRLWLPIYPRLPLLVHSRHVRQKLPARGALRGLGHCPLQGLLLQKQLLPGPHLLDCPGRPLIAGYRHRSRGGARRSYPRLVGGSLVRPLPKERRGRVVWPLLGERVWPLLGKRDGSPVWPFWAVEVCPWLNKGVWCLLLGRRDSLARKRRRGRPLGGGLRRSLLLDRLVNTCFIAGQVDDCLWLLGRSGSFLGGASRAPLSRLL